MITHLKVEDIHGNGFRAVETEPYDYFTIEEARCRACGILPIVAHRVKMDPEAPTVGEVVKCECGERFGAAYVVVQR